MNRMADSAVFFILLQGPDTKNQRKQRIVKGKKKPLTLPETNSKRPEK